MPDFICKTCGNNFGSFKANYVSCPACKSRNTIRYQMPKAKTKEEENEPMLDEIDRQICYAMKRAIMRAIENEPIFNISKMQLDDPGYTIVAMAEGSVPKSKLPVTIQIRYGNELLRAQKRNHQV